MHLNRHYIEQVPVQGRVVARVRAYHLTAIPFMPMEWGEQPNRRLGVHKKRQNEYKFFTKKKTSQILTPHHRADSNALTCTEIQWNKLTYSAIPRYSTVHLRLLLLLMITAPNATSLIIHFSPWCVRCSPSCVHTKLTYDVLNLAWQQITIFQIVFFVALLSVFFYSTVFVSCVCVWPLIRSFCCALLCSAENTAPHYSVKSEFISCRLSNSHEIAFRCTFFARIW